MSDMLETAVKEYTEDVAAAYCRALARLIIEDESFVSFLREQPEVQAVLAKHAHVASSTIR